MTIYFWYFLITARKAYRDRIGYTESISFFSTNNNIFSYIEKKQILKFPKHNIQKHSKYLENIVVQNIFGEHSKTKDIIFLLLQQSQIFLQKKKTVGLFYFWFLFSNILDSIAIRKHPKSINLKDFYLSDVRNNKNKIHLCINPISSLLSSELEIKFVSPQDTIFLNAVYKI